MLADRTGRRSPPPRLSGSDSDLAGREAFSAGFENEPSRRGGFCPDDHQTQSIISISIRSLERLEVSGIAVVNGNDFAWPRYFEMKLVPGSRDRLTVLVGYGN